MTSLPQIEDGAREPVAWQVRLTAKSSLGNDWQACTKELYDATLATGRYFGLDNAPACEVRPLFAEAAAPRSAAPGWVLVPANPTPQMLDAMRAGRMDYLTYGIPAGHVSEPADEEEAAYLAMIEVVPPPVTPSEGGKQ